MTTPTDWKELYGRLQVVLAAPPGVQALNAWYDAIRQYDVADVRAGVADLIARHAVGRVQPAHLVEAVRWVIRERRERENDARESAEREAARVARGGTQSCDSDALATPGDDDRVLRQMRELGAAMERGDFGAVYARISRENRGGAPAHETAMPVDARMRAAGDY